MPRPRSSEHCVDKCTHACTVTYTQVNLFQMSRDERVAFFINIYNALVVHAMAMFGPAENTLKRSAHEVQSTGLLLLPVLVLWPAPTTVVSETPGPSPQFRHVSVVVRYVPRRLFGLSACWHLMLCCRLYWFGAVKYNIGGHDFSANDIEHGVLRSNAASPTSVGSLLGRPDWARGQFRAGDPRLALVRVRA